MRWLSLLLLCASVTHGVKIIENGLAPPEIVHTPVNMKPRCVIRAPPLDLIFILDSSGSLRTKFQDEVDIIRRIVRHVTVAPQATRVMLVQFSGTQHLEFNFHKFTSREEILAALDVLRHVSGITRIGGGFEFTLAKMTDPENGMRDSSVPKIVYLLSDGRTHDFPLDWQQANEMRRRIPNVDIWAYGTGDYVATEALTNYTKSAEKIVTNQNLGDLEPQFEKFRGTEICDTIPTCVKGSDKPLDLLLLIDSSESVDQLFYEQTKFAAERIVGNINVHPDAVRVALITFSGNAFTHFKFNAPRFTNNTAVIRHINALRSIKGTTSTHLALSEARALLTSEDPAAGLRQGVNKLVIVMTDGHSQRTPAPAAAELRALGVPVIAMSVVPRPYVDENELLAIAGEKERVFTPKNLQDFEQEFMKYVGFGCEGMELGPDAKPRIRGATDISCNGNSVTLTVRTQRPMHGLMYAQQYHDDPKCVMVSDGSSREVSITFVDGTCGVTKVASEHRDGFNYNVTVILQFHPLIVTRADQGLDVNCFHQQQLTPQEIGSSTIKKLSDTQCSYRLHRYAPSQCVALDAKVGETLYHKWECDAPSNYQYLVHDCFAKSERQTVQFLDSDGCEVDVHFLETPNYGKFNDTKIDVDPFVFQEMSVFKFPGDGNILFKCQVSLCDMESGEPCSQMIPPRCAAKKSVHAVRQKRDRVLQPLGTKPGFAMTFEVETRTLNVIETETIRPKSSVRYCDIL